MSALPAVVGLVLAGGRSVRFGGEKAVALLDGKPLLLWAAERLRSVCANVGANVRPGTEAEAVAQTLGRPVLHDEPGDATGPLAGVKVGLIWAEAQGAHTLAVSPCDA
ncbi:MAG TPA: NTP transferase domain-containing protein, partial [Gammaproteobacteria bacterium]|nr:NTP transferase domain-containing protein [Gammaproteobacteria bacterium]